MRIPYNISKSALQAHQHKLNHVSHNIANVNTTGYKHKDVQFTELMHNAVTEQDVRLSEESGEPSLNTGVKLAASKNSFAQGGLTQTNDPFHLAIAGKGFFGVRNAEGERMLTRDGAFHLSTEGQLVNDRGDTVEMTNAIPDNLLNTGEVSISKNGDVTVNADGQATVVGQISLFLPPHHTAITEAGDNMYRINEGADVLTQADGDGDFGMIASGYLEGSTVDLAQSITDMMMSQRAYSMNSKVMQSTDEIYSLINQFNS
ncbi:flagellar basal-body rod protein FlgG [Alkalibacterium putridalgicola]|uniref:Flagellar basal body protein n=1 Tax=Alkalibacterium putridalgicola TaxID=426703 RepID=A0A1H7T629_9LACT|nr:flagellar hook-basal body protein [Alkalibacterium putridalgicola]GEK89338.1 flagellar basal body protein [Alkalibacterium putridalgicola]SEL80350.1 flagellar basal-body rod protein FlgG [Alkalibacterium putridalgicola]